MQQQFALNRTIRQVLCAELEQLTLAELSHIPLAYNNNIFWNIAHCIAVQQALCYGLSGLTTSVEAAFVKIYRKGTRPEGATSQQQVDQVHDLLTTSVDWLERDWEEGMFEQYTPYTVALGVHLSNINQAITFNNLHESIHYGYILALKKHL